MQTLSLRLAVVLLSLLSVAMAQKSPSSQPVLDPAAMDPTADPCTDFFQYSCGGWIKKNPIPADQSSWNVYSRLNDENQAQLRGILEEAAADPKKDGSAQKIGDYYGSCMDEKAIEALGAKPLKPRLDRIAAIPSKDALAAVAAEFATDEVFFEFGSDQDFKDATQVIATADQGGLGLPDRDYYLKTDAKSEELRRGYVAHVQRMLQLLGETPEQAKSDAQAVMRIETDLAKGSMTVVERRDPNQLYHKMSPANLARLSPAFHWDVYFSKIGMQPVETLNVVAPEFFKTLGAELQKEELGAWKAYLRWHVVHENAPYLSPAFVSENFNFFGKTLTGAEQMRPRWKRCTQYVDRDLGEAVGKVYVERYFGGDAKQRVLKMVKEIETAMRGEIDSLTWMSAPTKQRATEKLHAVANKIGYPDKWRDYSELKIVRGDALGNVTRAQQFELRRQLAKIGKPVDRGEWAMTPPTVNAYYNPQKNDINFPAGILQPPLFNAESDAAPNYGNTGGTIGHELTHGFDDEGRQFDAAGNLTDWWTPPDSKEFEKRASCISDQYAQYLVVDDIHINSKLTLGEDVADLGGLLLAYIAWKQDMEAEKLTPLDGLTPEQRFFVGYGQSWCGTTRPETLRMRAAIDPHSPEKYRANGVVSNMPEFQQAFHCKAGAPMVRENACRVW